MQVLAKYLLSSALSSIPRSPDDPAAGDPVEPVAGDTSALQPEPVAGDAAPEPEAAAPEPVVAPKPEPRMVPLRVMQERIGEESAKRQQEADRAAAAERRAADAEEMIRRLQADPAAPKPPAAAAPQGRTQDEFDAAVQRTAAIQRMGEDTVAVKNAGLAQFPDFNESLAMLNAIGLTNDAEIVLDILAVDKANAHVLIDKLAKDPERAAAFVTMNPRHRIAELTRMTTLAEAAKPAAAVEPKPTQISRAPAPRPSIAPQAGAPEVDPRTPDGNDKMDDSAWNAWYQKTYLKRTG